MSLRIGIVVNPLARRTGSPALPGRLEELCRLAGAEATVAVTRTPEELTGTLTALGPELDVLAICGGDGTLMATVSAAIPLYEGRLPALLLLPGGTMNTVARNLGVRGRPEAILGRLLASAATPKGLKAVPRFVQELMRVQTHDELPMVKGRLLPAAPGSGGGSGGRTRYGCIFGAAMGARYLSAYARRPGLLWAAWLGLRTVGSALIPGGGPFARWLFERTPAQLAIDGQLADDPAFRLILCATVPDVGLGMRVPWQAGCVPDRFQIIASSLPITQNALQVVRMQRGQPMLGQPHIDRLAQRVELRFESSQPLTLDGDLFAATAIELGLGPQLQILLPP